MTPGESTRPWPDRPLVVRITAPASAGRAARIRRFISSPSAGPARSNMCSLQESATIPAGGLHEASRAVCRSRPLGRAVSGTAGRAEPDRRPHGPYPSGGARRGRPQAVLHVGAGRHDRAERPARADPVSRRLRDAAEGRTHRAAGGRHRQPLRLHREGHEGGAGALESRQHSHRAHREPKRGLRGVAGGHPRGGLWRAGAADTSRHEPHPLLPAGRRRRRDQNVVREGLRREPRPSALRGMHLEPSHDRGR